MQVNKTQKLPVYILSGGRHSRFGSDKARAIFNGKALIKHVAYACQPFASYIKVIANELGKYDDLDLLTIKDLHFDKGPMGGVQTAIGDMEKNMKTAGWFFVVQCDLMGIKQRWLQSLQSGIVDTSIANTSGTKKIIVFKDHYFQSMPGLYHSDLKNQIDKFIEEDKLSLLEIIRQAHTHTLPLPKDWNESTDVNTKKDLRKLNK